MARGEIGSHDRVVVVSTANGLKFTDFKVRYHDGELPDVPNPKHANHPVLLPNDYTTVRDTVRRAIDIVMRGRARVKDDVRPAAPFVLLGLAFVLTLLLQKSFLVQSDEGYTLNAAWQMWNGMKMYDDFRLFVAPGAGCAVYAVWAMFGGPSFLAARVLSLVLSFSSIVAVVPDAVARAAFVARRWPSPSPPGRSRAPSTSC